MSEEKNKKQHVLNVLALNQTLFKKSAITGKGFKGGNKNMASTTPRGYHLWINGVHSLPETSEITEYHELGSIQYSHLITGMGNGRGEIKYWLGVTESEYVLLSGVILDDTLEETDEYAMDIASFVFKDRVPIPLSQHNENLTEIAGELLIGHFTVFLGENGGLTFKKAIESKTNTFITSVIDYYIENADNEVKSTIEGLNSSDEVENIVDEMNKLLGDDE